MAGMFPTNKEVTVFGKTIKFPGVTDAGEYTNGDFEDPDTPPSYIDADTQNLILHNLNSLIVTLGGKANNTDKSQLAALFTVTADALRGVKRDADGRAKVAAPAESDDIARKAEVDEVAGDLSAHTGDKNNPHGVTKTQVGLGNVDNTADSAKSVKSAVTCTGNAATATKWAAARNINGMSVQGDADRVNYAVCSTAAATQAKTVSCPGFSLVTGAEITVKFSYTNTQSSPTLNVNSTGAKAIYYRGAAIAAGCLAANRTYTFRYNGGQYELVGDIDTNTTYSAATASAAGLMSATDKSRLDNNYIVSKSLGTSSGYIKYSNGLIIQWGVSSGYLTDEGISRYGDSTTITLPVSFSNSSYAVAYSFAANGPNVVWSEIEITKKTANSLTVSYNVHSFIAIGY